MGDKLKGKRVAFLAADGVEQVELTEPWKAVEDEGGMPELISIKEGEIQAFDHLDHGVRGDEDAVAFTRAFFEAGKPVAEICHGPWMLVEADVVRGRKVTSRAGAAGSAD